MLASAFFLGYRFGMSEEIKKHPGGRPSSYTTELASIICDMIAEGMSVRQICQADGMPDRTTVLRWLAKNEEFRCQYARATEQRAETMAEEMIDIADDATNDWMERLGEDGQPIGYQINGDHIHRSRLRIETRKWLLGKLKPKKYGDRVTQEISGPDGGAIKHDLTLSADEAYKRLVDG